MDLMTELRDDMRSQNVTNLWKKHGRWVIYAAVSVVIVTAVLVYMKQHREQSAMAATGQYFEANRALANKEYDKAVTLLDAVEVSKNSEFYSLVLLKKAQVLNLAGKKLQADEAAAELAVRSDIFADVGSLLAKDAKALDMATPLKDMRAEWQAWTLLDAGKTMEALAIFTRLAADDKILPSQRERAEMMVSYLGLKS